METQVTDDDGVAAPEEEESSPSPRSFFQFTFTFVTAQMWNRNKVWLMYSNVHVPPPYIQFGFIYLTAWNIFFQFMLKATKLAF